jgi:ABC-type nitrate/sulfonate/bicarbonate transport system ATPase subunit
VLSNVEVGLGAQRSLPGARQRALDTLRAVDLEDKRDAWPAVLSGGQRQRVALARALVSEPRFLAFDEPLGALDALTRITMQRLLEKVWREQRFTALLVTHDVAEAVTIADRVLLGLETPTGGSFGFEDGTAQVSDKSVARVMFQEPRLLPWASVLSNVEVGLGAGHVKALSTQSQYVVDQERLRGVGRRATEYSCRVEIIGDDQ